ncbi:MULTISPECIES: 2-C-methyl-D-erythritol 4-phosphate cytidylyltransferase [unclassified Frankia]|uniref:2-C-methyl-D-erythritol 4-phosphate cytidylyltransferase n=1 Tax=unclassified Frankia TaxID=2632575 RepID=UPI002AD3BAB9|nr:MULTISPECIES: 2-C-methyl-D-erythritol 4-phosphate cytidylyltransferase [unclassified Frankia]
MSDRVAAVVPAAGRGERLGGSVPKALRALAGRSLVQHAVDLLTSATLVDQVVVAAPATELETFAALLGPGVRVIAGGAERIDSVRAAIAVLDETVGVVLVHDAARPLTPPALVDAVAAAVLGGAPAVIPVLAINDTIKQVDDVGRVVRTVSRDVLRAVQTPQGFRRDVLDEAYRLGGMSADGVAITDDAGLVEALGVPVMTVPGAPEAFKVTRPVDLLLAEALLARRD